MKFGKIFSFISLKFIYLYYKSNNSQCVFQNKNIFSLKIEQKNYTSLGAVGSNELAVIVCHCVLGKFFASQKEYRRRGEINGV